MKHIKHAQANLKKNIHCTVAEYPCDDATINIAQVKLSARYPLTGWALNQECKEVCYIIEGKGSITFEYETIDLTEGDVLMIDKNEKYFWNGNMSMVIASTPAWYPEQHKNLNS